MAAAAAGNGRPAPRMRDLVAEQASLVLKDGETWSDRFSKIRERNIYSTYHASLASNDISAAGVLNSGNFPMFTTPPGQRGQGLVGAQTMSFADTNFQGAGRVPDEMNLIVDRVGFSIESARQDTVAQNTAGMANGDPSPYDKDLMLGGILWQVVINTETPIYGPLSHFPQDGGMVFAVPSLLDYAAAEALVIGPPAVVEGGLEEGSVTATPWNQRLARLSVNAGNHHPAPGLMRKLDIPIPLAATTQFSMNLVIPRPIQLRPVAEGGTMAFRIVMNMWCQESYRVRG